MGANDARISKDLFDERKRYRRGIVQQGIPWIDADDNDVSKSMIISQQRVMQIILGDGYINDGFLVKECDDDGIRYNGNVNNFVVVGQDLDASGSRAKIEDGGLAGSYYVEGNRCVLFGDIVYNCDNPVPTGASYPDLISQKSIFPRVTDIEYNGNTGKTVITDSAANYNDTAYSGRGELANRSVTFFGVSSLTSVTIESNTDKTITVEGDITSDVQIYDRYRVDLTSLAFDITDVDTSAETFTVSGNKEGIFTTGSTFDVSGSTGNDGTWTVSTSSYNSSSDETTIEVAGDITDGTVDGIVIAYSTRKDGVYLNVYIDQIHAAEDNTLLHTLQTSLAAQVREQVVQEVFVREDIDTLGEFTDGMDEVSIGGVVHYRYTDFDGNVHYVKKIAEIDRTDVGGDYTQITDSMINTTMNRELIGIGESSPFSIIGSFENYSYLPNDSGLPDAPDEYNTTGVQYAAIVREEQTGSLSITGVDTSAETFTISGDHRGVFAIGNTFTVSGSSGNDGSWIVSNIVYSGGNTEITVTGDITDSTADGNINYVCDEGFYVINSSGNWEFGFAVEIENAYDIPYTNESEGTDEYISSSNVDAALSELSAGIDSVEIYDALIDRDDYASDSAAGTALKALIDDSNIKTIFIKEGTYELGDSDVLNISANNMLIAETGTVVKWLSSSSAGAGVSLPSNEKCELRNIKFFVESGGLAGQTSGLVNGNNSYALLENCSAINSAGEGFTSINTSSNATQMIKCYAEGCVSYGFIVCSNLLGCVSVSNDSDGFNGCSHLDSCKSFTNDDRGFVGCEYLSNCLSSQNGQVGNNHNYRNCSYLSGCKSYDCSHVGFSFCEELVGCESASDIIAFDSCTNLSGCYALNSTSKGFSQSNQLSSCSVSGGTPAIAFDGCGNIDGCKTDIGSTGFNECKSASSCEATDCLDKGFNLCEEVSSSRAINCANIGFNDSNNLSGCESIDGDQAFYECEQISSCYAYNNTGKGFTNCKNVSGCHARENDGRGFSQCNNLSGCEAYDNGSSGFFSCNRISACLSENNNLGFDDCSYVSSSYASSNFAGDWNINTNVDPDSCNN